MSLFLRVSKSDRRFPLNIYSEPSLKLVYPLSFFPVILIGWKKYATLQPKYCLAETPQALTPRRLGRQSAERERISEISWNVF
ncbi:hypothetical protein QNH26_22940 [Peribacillus frigoritolerans]|uniref:hypothetical protein n=1 Tax=Peribacillus frigoritolerans TaxID=450367 RepID=UPI0024C1C7C6|nr:hypothetical protein [Peribacillus frigoritolerans]WHX66473.1 hypothetical protein QNH26_22940 [Peribacillus frigoritolerans]